MEGQHVPARIEQPRRIGFGLGLVAKRGHRTAPRLTLNFRAEFALLSTHLISHCINNTLYFILLAEIFSASTP
jgi:hypothetical protein